MVKNSANSRSVNQRCRSTNPSRAQNSAPPKLDKVIRENVRTKSIRVIGGRWESTGCIFYLFWASLGGSNAG